jgi:hypothetical protein
MNIPIQPTIFKRPMPLGEISQNINHQSFRSPMASRKRSDSFKLSEATLKQLVVPIPHYRNHSTKQQNSMLGKRSFRHECYMPLSQTHGTSPFMGRNIQLAQFPLNFIQKSLKVSSSTSNSFFGQSFSTSMM